jgi:hypothetical protein
MLNIKTDLELAEQQPVYAFISSNHGFGSSAAESAAGCAHSLALLSWERL